MKKCLKLEIILIMASTNKMLCNLINIQSVGNKTNKVKNLVIDQNLDICMLTETWLSNNISDSSKIHDMKPNSHNFYHVPRVNKSGGGVGILIKKTYIASVINQQVFDSFEHINVKITHVNKNVQIVIVYKPPNTSKRVFLDEFGDFLDALGENRNILICGDFNLHLDNNRDNYVSEFIELLESHDLENVVDEPTSLSNHIIDLVIQNKNNKIVSQIKVEPECVVSPVHKLVHFSVGIWKRSTMLKTITYRNTTNFDATEFIDKSSKEIREINLRCKCNLGKNCTNEQRCVNCYTSDSKEIFVLNYNDRCPEVTKQIKVRENTKWYNNELRKLKKNKRKTEDKWKRSLRSKSQENWLLYKIARNEYNDLIEKTKKEYYNKIFSEEKNPKKILPHNLTN